MSFHQTTDATTPLKQRRQQAKQDGLIHYVNNNNIHVYSDLDLFQDAEEMDAPKEEGGKKKKKDKEKEEEEKKKEEEEKEKKEGEEGEKKEGEEGKEAEKKDDKKK